MNCCYIKKKTNVQTTQTSSDRRVKYLNCLCWIYSCDQNRCFSLVVSIFSPVVLFFFFFHVYRLCTSHSNDCSVCFVYAQIGGLICRSAKWSNSLVCTNVNAVTPLYDMCTIRLVTALRLYHLMNIFFALARDPNSHSAA